MILQLFYFYIILEGVAHSSKNQNAMERHTEKSGSHPCSPGIPLPYPFYWIFGVYPTSLGASLTAQLIRNLPAMQETPIQFLGQEDPLEKEQATHTSILGLPLWLSW